MSELGCRETLREVERYVDGECLQELTVQVEAHLAGCEDCHDHVEFKRHLKEIVAKKCGGDALPDDVVQRIRQGIRPSPP
ncbi:MAG TPA: zf-HC2 domain-containing protein [Actinomycetota bacterium]